MKWFQMRLIHRCLGTNVTLKEMGILNTDKCSFCNISKDSILHMFWECPAIQPFWKAFADFMNEKCENVVNFQYTPTMIIAGYDKNICIDGTVYFVTMQAKRYIYQCKLNKQLPLLNVFKCKLKYRFSIEEYNARRNMMYDDFVLRWLPYRALIQ